MDAKESTRAFFCLLEHPQIKHLMELDKCKTLMDKYVVAAAFIYFRRAKFTIADYTCKNFYLTLYLIHDLYEEIDDFKEFIIDYYLGTKSKNKKYCEKFLQERFTLLQRMDYNGQIGKDTCNKLMESAPHIVWNRTRHYRHAGVFYKTYSCKYCDVQ